MELEFFAVSASIAIDQGTNSMSLFEILEEVRASSFPAMSPPCCAVSVWRVDPADWARDFQVLLRITPPGAHGAASVSSNMHPEEGIRRHRAITRIAGIPVHEAGVIRFEVLLNGEHAAWHIADVLHEPGEQETSND
jgi:hypothetical protein